MIFFLGFANGRPPGSFALPGIHSWLAAQAAAVVAARSKAAATTYSGSNSGHHQANSADSGGKSGSGGGSGRPDQQPSPVGQGSGRLQAGDRGHAQNFSEMNPSGATQIRNIYSPDASNVHSPLNGGPHLGGFQLPPPAGLGGPSPPSTLTKQNERPNTLGSVIGVNPTINNNNNTTSTSTKGKKTRWLLCYPSGGAASSESPSPPTEEPPTRGGVNQAGSNVSTPSPTDGGFKIPNSQSNERPTSLPVALLNSSQRNSK